MEENEKTRIAFEILRKKGVRNYAKKAIENGFFIEAIIRIDLLMDSVLEVMFNITSSEDEKATIQNTRKAIGISQEEIKEIQNKMMLDKGLLDIITIRRIKKFKHVRNTMAHDVFGSMKLVLETGGEHSLKSFEENEKKILTVECKKGEELLDELLEKTSMTIDKISGRGN